jgi:preprotein translocase subunit SecG
MIELLAIAFAGFVAFLLGLLKYLPLKHGDRDPEHLLAIVSSIVLLLFLAASIGLLTGFSWLRIAVFYGGTVAAYFLSRLFPRREREIPQLPPEYVALSRRMDETFKAMKDKVARGGEPSQQDALTLTSYTKMVDESSEAMLQQIRRESRMVKMAALAIMAFFLIYMVIAILNT